jgi:hypothetical protein
VSFTPAETELLQWAVRDVIARRRLDGRASWRTMNALESLYRHLDTSVDGRESDTPAEESHREDLIDSKAAAEIIGCSTRWIIEICADLDGRKVGRQWMFPRHVAMEYAELKGVGGDGNQISRAGGGAVPSRAA